MTRWRESGEPDSRQCSVQARSDGVLRRLDSRWSFGTRRDRTTTIVRIMTTSRPRRPERSTWQLWSPAIVGVLVLASSLLGFASDERLRLWFALLGAAGFVLAVIAIVRAITYMRGVR